MWIWGGTSHYKDLGKCLLLVYQLPIMVSLCACWPRVQLSLQIADVGKSHLARPELACSTSKSFPLPNTCCVQIPIDYEHIRLEKREPEPSLLGTAFIKHLGLRLSRHDGYFDCAVSRLNTPPMQDKT